MKGQSTALDTVGTFQHEYIDILPSNWTTVSVLMNEDATELWLCRYHSGELPFILRLPMSRKSEEQFDDSEPFTYRAAHEELMNIIRLSDLSCHNPPDPAAKGGKSGWWKEREELDRRLEGLLKSVEDMWLGGFKSVFSLHDRRSDLLARFRKSFDSILDRHLPSRQGKQTKKNQPILHSHILDLLVGLDAGPEVEENLDDDVMDILFFVVDTVRWNGEANAHDEVDFDAMTVETIDALQSYHEAAGTTDAQDAFDKHLILRLDKRLHLFPWESLPCLQNKSITRVTSLVQLRDRILNMRQVSSLDLDRYHVARKNGTTLLNPSSDLVRTEATLSPQLALLKEQHDWSVYAQHKPSQPEFVSFLEQSNALLYFGHGSGTQYIGERSIQRLKKCADVVWLMGCSSGKVQTWGELESESVPLSYLLAGEDVDCDTQESQGSAAKMRQGMCMSVVATLWDVTDRDIDNFSMSVAKKWGLFGERKMPTAGTKRGEGTVEEPAVPKTPARKGRAPKTPAKTPRTPAKMATKVPKRNTKKKTVEIPDDDEEQGEKMSLATAVARSRDVCYLRYLNGAASVVYGIPTYLGD
ncbi:peptidase family C50-domain-containing protein [Elsinoe ampelina]|uniref:separase n=1 Tax=Elsinoe ampelina TaxID=302913 RepID=A0A6A6GHS6_9PEZI|nr:peptidase family C50-domain-containing protein [Elsinoe ampelina]